MTFFSFFLVLFRKFYFRIFFFLGRSRFVYGEASVRVSVSVCFFLVKGGVYVFFERGCFYLLGGC